VPPKPVIVDLKYPEKVEVGDLVEVKVTVANYGDTAWPVVVVVGPAEFRNATLVLTVYDYKYIPELAPGDTVTTSLYFRFRGEKNLYVVTMIPVRDPRTGKTRLVYTDYKALRIEAAEEKPWTLPLAVLAAVPLIAIPVALAAKAREKRE